MSLKSSLIDTMVKKLLVVMKAVLPLLILSVLLQTIPTAQAKFTKRQTGKIEGFVTDKFGAHVTKAKIKIEGKRIKKEIVSDEEGRFQVDLPIGVYQNTVYSPGFELFKSDAIKVQADNTTTINVPLAIATNPCPPIKHKGKGIIVCQ